MDAAGSRPEAIAVRGGRIAALGSAEQIDGLARPDTEVLDLEGRTLLPGLVDPHMHAAMLLMADWVDLSPMTTSTTDAVLATLRAASPAATGWTLAHRFDPSITQGHPDLSRAVLDDVAPDRPLLVLEGNGHVAHVQLRRVARRGHRPGPGRPAHRPVRAGRRR